MNLYNDITNVIQNHLEKFETNLMSMEHPFKHLEDNVTIVFHFLKDLKKTWNNLKMTKKNSKF